MALLNMIPFQKYRCGPQAVVRLPISRNDKKRGGIRNNECDW